MILIKYGNRFMLSVLLAAAISVSVSLQTPAQTRAKRPVARPVARVLKENISRAQIEPGGLALEDAKRQYKGAEYEKWWRDYVSEILVSTILNPLLEEYARAHAITA